MATAWETAISIIYNGNDVADYKVPVWVLKDLVRYYDGPMPKGPEWDELDTQALKRYMPHYSPEEIAKLMAKPEVLVKAHYYDVAQGLK